MPDAQAGSSQAGFLSPVWLRRIGIALLVAAAVVSVYYIFQMYLRIAATILLYAGVLTFVLQPVVEWLVRVSRARSLHSARIWATLLSYLLLGTALYFAGASITRTVRHNIYEVYSTWDSTGRLMPQQLGSVQQWYLRLPDNIRLPLATSVRRQVGNFTARYSTSFGDWALLLAKKVGDWVGLCIELIFVPLVAFYFLTDGSHIAEQALFFVPGRYRDTLLCYCRELDRLLRQYIRSQLILCAIAWVVVTVALLLMRVPGAFLLGTIAGISRAVPVIGPVIGGIPVLTMVLLKFHDPVTFCWVLVGFTVLHLFETKYLMPRILGDHLGVHPVFVIISLLVGYAMLGLLGMFLAPPAVAMIRFMVALHRGETPAPCAQAPSPV